MKRGIVQSQVHQDIESKLNLIRVSLHGEFERHFDRRLRHAVCSKLLPERDQPRSPVSGSLDEALLVCRNNPFSPTHKGER